MLHSITSDSAVATPSHNFNTSQNSEKSSSRAHWIPPKVGYSQTDNALADVAARHIKAFGVGVFLLIQRHADFLTGESCPTIEMLMEKLGISEPTAIKYVALLVSCNMITKRQTNWGGKEQGPKSRNFYRVLPSTLWDFSGLKKKVKAAPKELKADLKEIKPNNKHIPRDDNHELQESSLKMHAAKDDVHVTSSTSEESTSSETQKLANTLIAKGFTPDVHAVAFAEQVPDICRAALDQLSRARVKKENMGAWLRAVIVRQMNAQGRTPQGFEPSEADLANQQEEQEKKTGRKKRADAATPIPSNSTELKTDSPHGIPPRPAPARDHAARPKNETELETEPEKLEKMQASCAPLEGLEGSNVEEQPTPLAAGIMAEWERGEGDRLAQHNKACDAVFEKLPDDEQAKIRRRVAAAPGGAMLTRRREIIALEHRHAVEAALSSAPDGEAL